jgi:cell wall-associated NlpC family hydrolase
MSDPCAPSQDPARPEARSWIRAALFGFVSLCLLALGYFYTTGNAPPLRQHGATAEAETQAWLEAIRARARDGDWIAIRGYHPSDHLVATTTLRKLSHAAILDITQDEVIEAVAPRVRVVSLTEFVTHSHRLEIIRPAGATPAAGQRAVVQARAKIGTPYDFLGTIGLPSEKRAYCSELCAWAWNIEVDRKGPQKVLHPSDMAHYGSRVYTAGPRKLDPSVLRR